MSAALAMAVVVVVDGVGLTRVVILLEHIGGGGFVGSFATILPRGILLKEQPVHATKDHHHKSPPGVVVDND